MPKIFVELGFMYLLLCTKWWQPFM